MLLAGAAAIAALALGPAPSADARPCPGAPTFDCREIAVPLDRDGIQPGTVGIHVRTRAGASPDPPVLALAGGPGQSAVTLATTFETVLGPLLGDRTLVVLDRRGTGRSGPLRCPALERERGEPSRAAARCARRLGPRRAHHTTLDSVADIEAVRAALGVERLALFAVSYGSRIALAYAAAHPDRVERIVLDSPVPLAGPDPLQRSTLRAIPRVLRSVCARRCPGAGPDPVGDVARLVARLRSAASGRRSARRRAGLLSLVLGGEVDPWLRAALPGAARRALEGDAAPLRRLHARARRTAPTSAHPLAFSAALNAAVVCEELSFPWRRGAGYGSRMRAVRRTTAALPMRALRPFDRATVRRSDVLRLCARWPHAVAGPPPAAAPRAPTLVLAGGLDLLTPLSDSRRLARRLERARLLVDRRAGHSVLTRRGPTSCVGSAVRSFLAQASRRPSCAPRSSR